MRLFILSIVLLFPVLLSAQTINPDIYKKNIEILYDAAAKGFNEIKLEASGESPDGNKKFHAARKVSGASDVYIDVDSEDSHTYYAQFEAEDLESAQAKMEEMVTMAAEVVAEKGLVRKKGTDMNYEGYRKHTLEYDSDNIDLMGKYPSFEFGILKGSEPVTIELVVNEPLWK